MTSPLLSTSPIGSIGLGPPSPPVVVAAVVDTGGEVELGSVADAQADARSARTMTPRSSMPQTVSGSSAFEYRIAITNP